jgi:mRNA interferase MazF
MVMVQYDIVLVNLAPTIGSKIRKTHSCVVISPDEMNESLRTIVIAPVTSSLSIYPTRVPLEQHNVYGMVALDQIRTIDKQRVLKSLGHINPFTIKKIKAIIRETYVD